MSETLELQTASAERPRRSKTPRPKLSREAPRDAAVFEKLSEILERIADGQVISAEAARAALEAAHRERPVINATHPAVSPFNPLGDRDHPRPELVCRMFLPWEAERDVLTWEEIELLNLLAEAGSYAYEVHRTDGTAATAYVEVERDLADRPVRMLVSGHALFDQEHHRLVPPLRQMLREMLAQRPETAEAAARVPTIEARAHSAA